MYKVFDNVNHEFVIGEDDKAMIFPTLFEAEFCIKVGVHMRNDFHEMKRRWTKKDFQIVPVK